MSSKTDMLGDAVRKLVALPEEHLGTACDLLEKLSDTVWVRAGKRFLRKEEAWRVDFARDMTQEGWTLLEDTREPWPISADKLDLVPFLGDCKSYIGGEDVVSRARGDLKANLGQCHSEYLLKHQNEIPEEFRKHILVFTGTIWRRRFGHRSVPYLIWNGERWYLYFRGLEDGFCSNGRLLRFRKPA
mgnify:CR=1 FL=1